MMTVYFSVLLCIINGSKALGIYRFWPKDGGYWDLICLPYVDVEEVPLLLPFIDPRLLDPRQATTPDNETKIQRVQSNPEQATTPDDATKIQLAQPVRRSIDDDA